MATAIVSNAMVVNGSLPEARQWTGNTRNSIRNETDIVLHVALVERWLLGQLQVVGRFWHVQAFTLHCRLFCLYVLLQSKRM